MGYSCARRAAWRMDCISRACIALTGSSNTINVGVDTYFFERGWEQADGRMTGSIHKMLPNDTWTLTEYEEWKHAQAGTPACEGAAAD